MSFGGRAGKVAQQIPHSARWTPWGLPYLISVIEFEIGNEAQDRTRLALTQFFNYSRPRSGTALDHVLNNDLLLQEAMASGLGLNAVAATHFLLESARLNNQEYDNLMTPPSARITVVTRTFGGA